VHCFRNFSAGGTDLRIAARAQAKLGQRRHTSGVARMAKCRQARRGGADLSGI
jgi:hypothetical protein